jgi:WD40 repeat protein
MMILDACKGSVTALAFSPEGESLLVAGKDASFRLWSPPVVEREIPTRDREVTCFAYSSKGDLLAFATIDRALYLHRIPEGTFQSLPMQKHRVTGLGFLQNDQTLAISVGDRMQSLHTPVPISLLRLSDLKPLSFVSGTTQGIRSLDLHLGKRLLAWASDSRTVEVRDLGKSTPLFSKKYSVDTRRIAISPDGTQLAVGFDWRIDLLSLSPEKESRTLTGHKGLVTSLVFSPDGKRLLSGSWDQTVKVWDATTGDSLHSFDWQIERIVGLAIAPDGLRAAAGSDRGQVVIWDME